VNGSGLGGFHLPAAVDGLTQKIEHAAEHTFADGHLHGAAGVNARLAATQAVGGGKCNAAHLSATHVPGDFAD
jgi:hypothetical protein